MRRLPPAPASLLCLCLAFPGGAAPARALQEAGQPYDDRELERAARERLERLYDLRSATLSVSVRAGLARIEGQVDSLAQAEKARRAVAQIRGLAELDSRIQVRDAAVDDARLKVELEREIGRFPGLQGLVIDARVERAEATLAGRVRTAGERRLLLEAARAVEGVRAVDLRIEVSEGADEDDATLQRQIRGLLADRVRFPIRGRVQVTVRDRAAVLEGVVPRLIDRLDAEEVAWHAAGVRGVQNLIRVVPRPRVRHYSEMQARPAGVEPPAPQPDPETPERNAPEREEIDVDD
jgi:osmotically-inducible protein OsmY